MVQTLLLKAILENAEDVMKEFGDKYLTASHIVVAIADFCKTRYNGLDSTYLAYPRFEEERLRYIFKKEIKLAGYIRLALSINKKMNIDEKEFDFKSCERIAKARGADILSSDVVFVSAMTQLGEKHKRALRTISSEETVFALLEDTDKNIFDYTIANIQEVCILLKKKADEAAKIRDWKPAAKFAEPEELIKQFFKNIYTSYENNVLHIVIPKFLKGDDLKLSIYKVNDYYILHDNGCAVKCLSMRIDNNKVKKVLEVLWGKSNLHDNKLFTEFTNVKCILYFIQEVILTANADLYYEYFKEEPYGRRRYIDSCNVLEDEKNAKAFDVVAFLNNLKDTLKVNYDENRGLIFRFDSKYCNCSYGISILIETLEDGVLRFSDAYKNKSYETGEMLEALYFGSEKENVDMYYEVMHKLSKPFDMQFDMNSSINFPEYRGKEHNHKNPYMLSRVDNWLYDFYNFINSAVIISVVADRLNYEKLRDW